MCRKKKHLYKKAKKSNSEDHWVAYRTLNNTLKKKCNSAKWSHFEALADKLQVEKNSKPFWNYMYNPVFEVVSCIQAHNQD